MKPNELSIIDARHIYTYVEVWGRSVNDLANQYDCTYDEADELFDRAKVMCINNDIENAIARLAEIAADKGTTVIELVAEYA